MKTYINNNITSGKSLTGDDDSKITQINGYKSFREQYFTVHLSNIYASKISETNDTLE
jgi:hypothetical protein